MALKIHFIYLGTKEIYCMPCVLISPKCPLFHNVIFISLTFRNRASPVQDRHFATLQRTLFIYLINKYISLSDIYLTVRH